MSEGYERMKARRAARDASGVAYVEGSIYENMAACVVRSGVTLAQVHDYDVAAEIAAALNASPSQRLDAATVERCALDWLAGHPRCSLEHFGPVYGDDDDQSSGWRIMRENGSINDREWDEIGRGDTPLAAIQAAVLATEPHGGKGA